VRIGLELIARPRQGEKRGGAQGVGPPFDPQAVDDIEEVRKRQVAQP